MARIAIPFAEDEDDAQEADDYERNLLDPEDAYQWAPLGSRYSDD